MKVNTLLSQFTCIFSLLFNLLIFLLHLVEELVREFDLSVTLHLFPSETGSHG